MIFVTVGGGPYYGFNRLVAKMDEIAAKGTFEVVIQSGCSTYVPRNAQYFKFTHMEDMLNYYKKADAIVAHASGAPVIYAREFNLPLILVPRLVELSEIFDDHQLKTAKRLEAESMIELVYDIKNLEYKIHRSLEKKEKGWPETNEREIVVNSIKNFLTKGGKL